MGLCRSVEFGFLIHSFKWHFCVLCVSFCKALNKQKLWLAINTGFFWDRVNQKQLICVTNKNIKKQTNIREISCQRNHAIDLSAHSVLGEFPWLTMRCSINKGPLAASFQARSMLTPCEAGWDAEWSTWNEDIKADSDPIRRRHYCPLIPKVLRLLQTLSVFPWG